MHKRKKRRNGINISIEIYKHGVVHIPWKFQSASYVISGCAMIMNQSIRTSYFIHRDLVKYNFNINCDRLNDYSTMILSKNYVKTWLCYQIVKVSGVWGLLHTFRPLKSPARATYYTPMTHSDFTAMYFFNVKRNLYTQTPTNCKDFVLDSHNKCISSTTTSKNITIISKPKNNYKFTVNYRPTALLSVKCMKNIILDELWKLQVKQIKTKHFAIRSGFSMLKCSKCYR